jgi:hypothetical protein
MSKFAVAVVVSLVALSGCDSSTGAIGRPGSPAWNMSTTSSERSEYYRAQCVGYGFRDGTQEMAQCVQIEASNVQAVGAARSSAALSAMSTYPAAPKTTNCRQMGTTISCTTY